MVGRLTLDQEVGVRIPAPQPHESPGNGAFFVAGDSTRAGGTAAAAWKACTGVRGWLDFDGETTAGALFTFAGDVPRGAGECPLPDRATARHNPRGGNRVSALVAALFAFMAAPAGAEGPATSSTATATTATAPRHGRRPEYAPVAAAQLSPDARRGRDRDRGPGSRDAHRRRGAGQPRRERVSGRRPGRQLRGRRRRRLRLPAGRRLGALALALRGRRHAAAVSASDGRGRSPTSASTGTRWSSAPASRSRSRAGGS